MSRSPRQHRPSDPIGLVGQEQFVSRVEHMMEGALRAGERAAAEVPAALGLTRGPAGEGVATTKVAPVFLSVSEREDGG